MRRLRILQIFSRYIHFGGEESSVFRIGDALQENHDVEYFIGSTKEFLGSDITSKIRAPFHAFYNLPIAQRLRKYQELGQFDLWQIHNVLPALSPSVYQTAFDLNVPVVHYLHNYRMGCTNGFFLNHGRPCERCLGGNFWPALQTACWQNSRLISGFMGVILRRVRSIGTFRKVAAWISISEFQKKKHVEIGIPAERIYNIHHFYESITPPPPTPTSGDTLFLGRLSREKGVDLLLRAWAKVRNANRRLVIAGTGPEETFLKKLSSDLNLANVVFTGFLNKEQQVSLWSYSSALVVPSIWDEPFGMVVLEAWAKDRPIVAFAKGALPELIHHGVNGLLADPFSVESL
ncbi:MAG: glycosyltransferase family 1 protein, partial [Verrucomicrobia bacterium]|nr:glycosyltransferase family 1 protein [Verrucomicrobiota bacterium]